MVRSGILGFTKPGGLIPWLTSFSLTTTQVGTVQSSSRSWRMIQERLSKLTTFQEYREAFALFDKKGTGQVPRESLGELVRSLGQNPTQAEVAELVRNVGATCEFSGLTVPKG